MTSEAIAGFRAFFRLKDVLNGDNPEDPFEALVDMARWAAEERTNPNPDNDALLSHASDFTQVYMGLILWLATVDRQFFNLAKRMAARTLVKHERLSRRYLEMAAALLVAGDGPKHRSPTTARNVAVILAVAVGRDAGRAPTENSPNLSCPESGCARSAALLGMEYSAIAKVWRKKM